MGSMTNRNACRGNLTLVLAVLVALAGFKFGLAQDQNQTDNLVGYEATDRLGRKAFIGVRRGATKEELLAAANQADFSFPKEIEQIRKVAEQGYATAQFELGIMYGRGEGVPVDYREAVKWYRIEERSGICPAVEFEEEGP